MRSAIPEDFITKGPGRVVYCITAAFFYRLQGVSLAKVTLLGVISGIARDVTQRHVKYLDDREVAGEVIARDASVTDWVAKDDKAVVEDTREVTTWRVSPTDWVYDYTITVRNMTNEPIHLDADPHHAGFHFRAAQEAADAKGRNGKASGLRRFMFAARGRRTRATTSGANENWAHRHVFGEGQVVRGDPF